MKLLSVNHTSDFYGASRCLERVASRMRSDGHELIVVIPAAGTLKNALEQVGVRVLLHPAMPIVDRAAVRSFKDKLRLALSFPLSVLWLAYVMLRFRVDVVHTNSGVIFSPAFAARLVGKPHVWHIREFFLEFPSLWRYYERVIHYLSASVVAISVSVKEQFSERLWPGIAVVYDGLPRAEFDRTDQVDASTEFKERFGLVNGPLCGVIGRLKWARKGQEVLIRAAAILREKYPEAKYLLIGSTAPGNEVHFVNFKSLVQELNLDGVVLFTGDIADVRSAYVAMDVTVAPSVDPEPFGCIVMESMALGTPVVGSNAAGIAEQIVDHESGLLFKPGDERALADALDRLFGDAELRREISMNGYKRFLAEFEMEKSYQDYMRVFTSVLQNPRWASEQCERASAQSKTY